MKHFTPHVAAVSLLGAALAAAPTPPVPPPVAPAEKGDRPAVRPPSEGGTIPHVTFTVKEAAVPATYETQVITAPAPTISLVFGNALAFAADRLLVSGTVRVDQASDDGQMASYQLADDRWVAALEMAQVHALQPGDFVFQRLAGGGNTVFTNVDRPGSQGGMVAVFEPAGNTWAQRGLITLPAATPRPGFGSSISTDGKSVAIASVDLRYRANKGERQANPEVFVYAKQDTGWVLDATVTAPVLDGKARDALWFGTSVAISGDTLAVGVPSTIPIRAHEETPISGQAAVLVYRRVGQTWLLEGELLGNVVTHLPSFGSHVALEGDLLAVRAMTVTGATAAGRVWMYRRQGTAWTLEAELVPGKGMAPSRAYGGKLVINQGRVFVADTGARAADEPEGGKPGCVFVFSYVNGVWQCTHRLSHLAPCGQGSFGTDMVAKWPWVAVSRVKNDRHENRAGGAYLYKLSDPVAPPAAAQPTSAPPAAAPPAGR